MFDLVRVIGKAWLCNDPLPGKIAHACTTGPRAGPAALHDPGPRPGATERAGRGAFRPMQGACAAKPASLTPT